MSLLNLSPQFNVCVCFTTVSCNAYRPPCLQFKYCVLGFCDSWRLEDALRCNEIHIIPRHHHLTRTGIVYRAIEKTN